MSDIFLLFMFFPLYNFFMNIKKVYYERLMIFFAGLVQLIGFFISINIEDFSKSYLPYFNIIVPVANISCAAVCFFLLAFPKIRILHSMVLFVQGIVMTLNSLIFLGVFLYSLGIILLFCYDYLNSKKNVKVAICIFSLLISFMPILFKNVFMFFMATAYLFFILFSYFHIYVIIKSKLSKFFPFHAHRISAAKLPEPGEIIKLSDFGLSERQINLLKEYKKGDMSYKKLAETFSTSKSTIKKEMSKICKSFGVINCETLLFLLGQYEIS